MRAGPEVRILCYCSQHGEPGCKPVIDQDGRFSCQIRKRSPAGEPGNPLLNIFSGQSDGGINLTLATARVLHVTVR